MRVDPELTYQDYKDWVEDAFRPLGKLGYGKTVKEVETDKTKAKVRSSQTNQTEKQRITNIKL